MQPPFRRHVAAVEAGAEEPVAGAGFVFDAVVVADVGGADFARRAAPPLFRKAFGAFGSAHAADLAAPAEEHRRVVGERSRRVDRLGAGEEAHGAGTIPGPGFGWGRGEGRAADHGAFGDVARISAGAPDPV